MTWIWTGPEAERGKATRPTTTNVLRLVDSQRPERHQAQHVPEVWPVEEQSLVDRWADGLDRVPWWFWFAFAAVAFFLAYLIVSVGR